MSLATLLETKHAHLLQLTTLLQQEQELLVQSRPNGQLLAQLATAKRQRFAELEKMELSLRDAQRQLGVDNTHIDVERAALQGGYLPLWRQILSTAQQARHLNRLNGMLIQQSLEHNQRALNTLQELSGSFVYGANGKPCTTRSCIDSAV